MIGLSGLMLLPGFFGRNETEICLDSSLWNANAALKIITKYVSEICSAFVPPYPKNHTHEEILVGWKPPSEDWVKANADGASKGNPGQAGAGIIRDYCVKWLVGLMANVGICTSVRAELWAAKETLELAWNLGFRKVILEVD